MAYIDDITITSGGASKHFTLTRTGAALDLAAYLTTGSIVASGALSLGSNGITHELDAAGVALTTTAQDIIGAINELDLSGGGYIVGPASATDSAVVLFDATTGKLAKTSTLTYVSGCINGLGTTANGTTDVINLKDSASVTVFDVDTDGNTSVAGSLLANGNITKATGSVLRITPATGYYTAFGTGTTAQSLNTSNDVFVTGKLEIGGLAYFAAGLNIAFNQPIVLRAGSYIQGENTLGNMLFYASSSTETLTDAVFALGSLSNSLLIKTTGNRSVAYNRGLQTNPTLTICSAAATITHTISFCHNQTDGVISVGFGAVNVSSTLKTTGGRKKLAREITASTGTLAASDEMVLVNYDGTFTLTIPTALITAGEGMKFTLVDKGLHWADHTLTVATQGTETINGSTDNWTHRRSTTDGEFGLWIEGYISGGAVYLDRVATGGGA